MFDSDDDASALSERMRYDKDLSSELAKTAAIDMENVSLQETELQSARAWWQRCAPDERAYWRRQAGSCHPIEAWQAYRRTLVSPPCTLHKLDTRCPECNCSSIEALDFPDGRAIYCRQCGYRDLDCDSGPWISGPET